MNENIESSNAIKQVSSDADQYHELVNNKTNGLMMGAKQVELVDGDQLRIDSIVYNLTNGLWSFITKRNPTNYTTKDYVENSRPRNRLKFHNILSKMLVQENESSGHGINFLPADINSLVTKLQVLFGEFLAGNKSTRSQIVAILDNLKEKKHNLKKKHSSAWIDIVKLLYEEYCNNLLLFFFYKYPNSAVGNSAAMVKIFGETHTNATAHVEKVHAVKKVTITRGRIGDYVNKIVQSCKLGYTPYHISCKNNLKPVRASSNSDEVYDHSENIADLVLNASMGGKKALIYWKMVDYDGVVSALQGEPGPQGVRGKRE